MRFLQIPTALLLTLILSSCSEKKTQDSDVEDRYVPKEYVELKHPEWSRNATIYEVNIRQFTPEGTFKAFEAHMPRLKEIGIDILWLMPIHPIGQKNRKGKLGSYYSVKDYYAVNPEMGTLADLKALVKKAHGLGMHVIIDWVGNHSAWDNQLVTQHPEWYTRTPQGKFQPTPWYDWEDIIDFDYNQPGVRKYMTEALKYWVNEADIDGYRCDVAGFIPVDFWENARAELDAIKPVFMLAEWESRDLHKKAFDMTYSWSLWDKMRGVCTRGEPLAPLVEYMAHDVNTFPHNAYRMTFTDNHDKNSWEGNQYSNFGNGLHAAMVMACTVNGMPLVYGGQEAGLDRSLAFFEKDLIAWKEHPNAIMYKKLFGLKHTNHALWNGAYGGVMERIYSDRMNEVISFAREKDGDKIISLINFSDKDLTAHFNTTAHPGAYKELFTDETVYLKEGLSINLKAWGYKVLVKQ